MCVIGQQTPGLYLKWLSNLPKIYKINLIKCFCSRAVRICLSETLLYRELDYYKKIFLANGCPFNITRKTMRKFEINKHNTSKNNKNKNNNNKKKQTNNRKQQIRKDAQTIYISMTYYNNFSSYLAQNIKRILGLPDKEIISGLNHK